VRPLDGDAEESEMSETTFTVTGMTCHHCVQSVTSEVSEVVGVTAVHADVATGLMRVVSDEPVDPKAVHVAVREAGYEVAL